MSFQKAIVITTIGKRPSAIQMADVSDDGSFFGDGGCPRKRRRLTHLSADEKMLRRKLKNRVAAQTARDRKKALMQELEEKVAQLQEENKLLLKENTELRLNQSAIQKENELLKTRSNIAPSVTPVSVPCKVEGADCTVTPCKTEPDSPGSAAPAVSLPKEQIQALSRVMMHYAAWALTLSLMLCFISWKNSVEKAESSASSRKRKQTKPARRPSVSSESSVVKVDNSPLRPAWWGPQQQTWTPSMN